MHRAPSRARTRCKRAGYATDPKYAQKLVGMIQQFKNMGEKVVKAYSHDLKDLF